MPTRSLLTLLFCAIVATHSQGQSEAQPLYQQAIALHQDGKIDEALAKVKEAVKASPKDGRLTQYEAELQQALHHDQLYQHARQAPAEAEASIPMLAAYLVKPAKTAEDKARVIFAWVTDRIVYDVEGWKTGKRGDQTAAGVLKSRKAVCEGYSNLYLGLAQAAGLEVVLISGFGKGGGYEKTGKPENHAWNAVHLDGQWRLIDATWGAGSVTGTGFKKQFKEHHFLADPEAMIISHLPRDPKWQLLSSPISEAQFLEWPKVNPTLFNYITPAAVRAAIDKDPKSQIVEPLQLPKGGPAVVIKAAPLERVLKAGQSYRFQLDAPGFTGMALANGPKPVVIKGVNGVFEIEVTAQKGELILAGAYGGKQYAGVIRYQVK